jgi:hypothetical protein
MRIGNARSAITRRHGRVNLGEDLVAADREPSLVNLDRDRLAERLGEVDQVIVAVELAAERKTRGLVENDVRVHKLKRAGQVADEEAVEECLDRGNTVDAHGATPLDKLCSWVKSVMRLSSPK